MLVFLMLLPSEGAARFWCFDPVTPGRKILGVAHLYNPKICDYIYMKIFENFVKNLNRTEKKQKQIQ